MVDRYFNETLSREGGYIEASSRYNFEYRKYSINLNLEFVGYLY